MTSPSLVQGSPRLEAATPSYTRFAQRIRRRYAREISLLPPGMPDAACIASLFEAIRPGHPDDACALRVTRQLVLERLLCLDCEGEATVPEVTGAMTLLAEFALNLACRNVQATLDAQHGAPMTTRGQRARMWIVGIGKLGARELNVSSDIDLIYVYDDDGETLGTPEGRR